jgi:hypothetical protein
MRDCKFHSKQVVDRNQALHSPVSVARRRSDNFENDTQATKFVFNRRRSTAIAQNESERAAEIGVQSW